MLTSVAIALGSNLGDRRAHIEFAAGRLGRLLQDFRLSSVYETLPVGLAGPQPLFLNAAAAGETALPARDLLDALLAIEKERGRERRHASAARTLDLDLVLFGDQRLDDPQLTIPHPRFRERRFVLEPLAEIAPGMRDPVADLTVAELLARLTRAPEANRR